MFSLFCVLCVFCGSVARTVLARHRPGLCGG
jgi:hypothetical protein